MKKRYVIREDSYEGREIKKFKNEREAIAFIDDERNMFQYGSLVLMRFDHGDEVRTWIWNEANRTWKEQKGGETL